MGHTVHNGSRKAKQVGRSFGFGNSRSAGKDVARGPSPMVDGSPCSNRPELLLAGYPRAQLIGADACPYLRKPSSDLAHGGAFRGIFLDHVGDEWCHKLEPFVFLARAGSQGTRFLGNEDGTADLQVILPNQIPKIVHISGKWVAEFTSPVFGSGLVASPERLVEWRSFGKVILAGVAKVNEKVSCRTLGARI